MRDAVSEWGEHPIYPRNHAVVRRRWHSARDPLTSTSRSARPICLSLSALSHSVRAYTESSRTMTLPRELEVSRETFTRTTAVFAARARGAPPAGRVPVHGDDARNLAGPVRADADLAGCRRGLRSAFQRKRLARCAKPQHGPREDALGRRGRSLPPRSSPRAREHPLQCVRQSSPVRAADRTKQKPTRSDSVDRRSASRPGSHAASR